VFCILLNIITLRSLLSGCLLFYETLWLWVNWWVMVYA